MSKCILTSISKKLRNISTVICPLFLSGWESSVSREKKSTVYKEQALKQVEAYLEKIKDISKGRLVYIDEKGSQTQMYRRYVRSKTRKTGQHSN